MVRRFCLEMIMVVWYEGQRHPCLSKGIHRLFPLRNPRMDNRGSRVDVWATHVGFGGC